MVTECHSTDVSFVWGRSLKMAVSLLLTIHVFYSLENCVIQAAYEGTCPEHDAWGKPLTGDRARMAGKPLCGGPWALTQFRTALQNVGVIRIQKIKYTLQGQYAILYIKLNIRC